MLIDIGSTFINSDHILSVTQRDATVVLVLTNGDREQIMCANPDHAEKVIENIKYDMSPTIPAALGYAVIVITDDENDPVALETVLGWKAGGTSCIPLTLSGSWGDEDFTILTPTGAVESTGGRDFKTLAEYIKHFQEN